MQKFGFRCRVIPSFIIHSSGDFSVKLIKQKTSAYRLELDAIKAKYIVGIYRNKCSGIRIMLGLQKCDWKCCKLLYCRPSIIGRNLLLTGHTFTRKRFDIGESFKYTNIVASSLRYLFTSIVLPGRKCYLHHFTICTIQRLLIASFYLRFNLNIMTPWNSNDIL